MKKVIRKVRDYETGREYTAPFIMFYNGMIKREETVRDIQKRRLLRRAVINKRIKI